MNFLKSFLGRGKTIAKPIKPELIIKSDSEDDNDLTIEQLAEKRKKIKDEIRLKQHNAAKQAFNKEIQDKELNIETFIIDYFIVNKTVIRERIADSLFNNIYDPKVLIWDYNKELWFKKLEKICQSHNPFFPSSGKEQRQKFRSEEYIGKILKEHQKRLLSIINSDKRGMIILGWNNKKRTYNISYYFSQNPSIE